MPTRGRHGWAADVLRMFHEQTYSNKEIVIIDDAADPSFIHKPLGVIYDRAPHMNIGAKRNLACSRATGAIICHWDSDDTYRPDRVETQVQQLLSSEVDLVGYNSLLFEEADGALGRYEFRSLDPNFCAGVSMMYWRDSWARHPFDPKEDVGEDHTFMLTRTRRGFEHEGRIVARIHWGNTADKRSHFNHPSWRKVA